MEILAAQDLVGSYRGAAELAGCDHHTVRRHVKRRAAGLPPYAGPERSSIIDAFRPKIEGLLSGRRAGSETMWFTTSSSRWA
jgi:hypothetical protein